MARYLITQSLLSAWLHTYSCADGLESDAREDFLRVLARLPTEKTEAMANGIAFENEVYAAAAGTTRLPHPKWEPGIQEVAGYIKDAPTQVRLSRNLELDGTEYLVYGILDALKAGTIYDVKFSSKSLASFDAYGRYLDSPQHPAYFYLLPEARAFTYLLSDGHAVYTETYTPADTKPLTDMIRLFTADLERDGLLDTYHSKWEAKENAE